LHLHVTRIRNLLHIAQAGTPRNTKGFGLGASLTVPLLLAALSLTEATAAEPSLLTLSAELPADDLSRWLSETAPAQLQGQGGKKVCQRVLGFKVCGNANWNYLVERTAPIDIPQVDINAPSLTLAAPLSVNGTVGVDGDIGKALGLDAVPVKADMTLILNAVVSGNALGCPQVKVSATPQWAAKPEATLPGNIKINLTDALESALRAQVANWQKAVNEALDCDAVLSQLKPLWSECYANATRAETGPALWRATE